jgi:hypothetical protein
MATRHDIDTVDRVVARVSRSLMIRSGRARAVRDRRARGAEGGSPADHRGALDEPAGCPAVGRQRRELAVCPASAPAIPSYPPRRRRTQNAAKSALPTPFTERVIGTLRREMLGPRYNLRRPRRALQQHPPDRRIPPPPGATTQLQRRDRLGGLVHEYQQVACPDRVLGTHKVKGRVSGCEPHRVAGSGCPVRARQRHPVMLERSTAR